MSFVILFLSKTEVFVKNIAVILKLICISLFSLTAHAQLNVSPQIQMVQIEEARSVVARQASNNADVLKMYDAVVNLWSGHEDFDLLLQAIVFSAKKHEGQTRKDILLTPYIIHPMGVARILWEEGNVRSTNVLIAALLHDTLEDTDASAKEIESLFGKRVRKTVEELTNDPDLSTEKNKQRQIDHAPFLSLNAQLVKLADRLYNIRDLRNPPPNWTPEKVEGYLNWGKKLLKALHGTNASLEQALKQEITAQESLRNA